MIGGGGIRDARRKEIKFKLKSNFESSNGDRSVVSQLLNYIMVSIFKLNWCLNLTSNKAGSRAL